MATPKPLHIVKQILIGVAALGICGCMYLFIWMWVYLHANPPLSCYTAATPSYAEETICFVFSAFAILWAVLLYKYPNEGIWLKLPGYGSLAFLAFMLVITIPHWIGREPFYKDFDAPTWQTGYNVFSGGMARRLVHDQTLIGKHKNEVTAMLGESTHRRGYVLDVDPYLSLYIEYDSDTVKRVSLACSD